MLMFALSNNRKDEERADFRLVLLIMLLLSLPMLLFALQYNRDNFDVRLASGFLHGHLYADAIEANYGDIVVYNGQYYLPFGYFPSLIEIPFVAIMGLDFNAIWLQFALSLVNVWLAWQLFTLLGLHGQARVWLMLLFFIGALYLPTATHSGVWNMIRVVAYTLTLAALVLAERQQWLGAGLLLGFAVGTRFSLVVNIIYFVLLIFYTRHERQEHWWRNIALLMIGLAGPMLFLLWYNFARFGNPLETGYGMSLSGTLEEYRTRNQYGLLNPRYIPTNFFYMFLKGPDSYPLDEASYIQFPYLQPAWRGMSIFFTTPAIVYLMRVPLRDPRVRAALPALGLGILTLLLYYHTGGLPTAPQYGYSYLLDFMPIAFVALIAALRHVQGRRADEPISNLPIMFKWLAAASIVLGLWGTFWVSDTYRSLLGL